MIKSIRNEQGMAMMLVLVTLVIAVITGIVLFTILSGHSSNTAMFTYSKTALAYAEDGLTRGKIALKSNVMSLGSSQSYTMNGWTITVSLTDRGTTTVNGVVIKKCYVKSIATITAGDKTYSRTVSQIVNCKQNGGNASDFAKTCALFANNNFTFTGTGNTPVNMNSNKFHANYNMTIKTNGQNCGGPGTLTAGQAKPNVSNPVNGLIVKKGDTYDFPEINFDAYLQKEQTRGTQIVYATAAQAIAKADESSTDNKTLDRIVVVEINQETVTINLPQNSDVIPATGERVTIIFKRKAGFNKDFNLTINGNSSNKFNNFTNIMSDGGNLTLNGIPADSSGMLYSNKSISVNSVGETFRFNTICAKDNVTWTGAKLELPSYLTAGNSWSQFDGTVNLTIIYDTSDWQEEAN